MPFVEPMPWERDVFDKWQEPIGKHIIPLYDEAAWQHIPHIRPLMNKLDVADKCGYKCGPTGVEPPKDIFPIICKPTYNIYGSSVSVQRFESFDVYSNYIKEHYSTIVGHFWMPEFKGTHVSTDVVVCNNEILWTGSFEGIPNEILGLFDYWKSIPTSTDIITKISEFITLYFPLGFYGVVNFETIGGNIIELNPRLSTQFCQFYGDQWFKLIIDLYKTRDCERLKGPFDEITEQVQGVSVPIWATPSRYWCYLKEVPNCVDCSSDCVNGFMNGDMLRVGFISTETIEQAQQIKTKIKSYGLNRNLIINI